MYQALTNQSSPRRVSEEQHWQDLHDYWSALPKMLVRHTFLDPWSGAVNPQVTSQIGKTQE